jgi:hypothetical protein
VKKIMLDSFVVFPPRSLSNPENQDNCNGTPTHAEMKKLWFGYTYELLWTFKVIIFHTHFLSPRVEIYLDD